MPPITEDLAIKQTMVAYGNRQNPTAFARANNSDLLLSLKHLMETSLYVHHGDFACDTTELIRVGQFCLLVKKI